MQAHAVTYFVMNGKWRYDFIRFTQGFLISYSSSTGSFLPACTLCTSLQCHTRAVKLPFKRRAPKAFTRDA